jgi:PAS domain S-box-containing protein
MRLERAEEQTLSTILVVDDFADGRFLTTEFLRHAGFEVRGAATGMEALALAADRPDLIVLDVNLPDLDGFEVCRRLKATPTTASIPVLHLSAAHRTVDDRVRGLEGGADGYLTLPVEPEELIATVKVLLRIRRADAKLRKSQERYRQLIDTVLEGVWTIDAQATTTYVNERMASMLGHGVADMLGRSVYDSMDTVARDQAEAAFERARQGITERFDFCFRRSNGTDLWAIVSTHPIVGDGGEFVGALWLVTDITDRRRAEKAEQEAALLPTIAALATATSHEINNPLMAVTANLELLDRTQPLDARGRACLEGALTAADEIKTKVRRLRRIAKLEFSDDGPGGPPMLDLEKSSQGMDDGC